MNHVLSARQFSRGELGDLFDLADEMQQKTKIPEHRKKYAGKHVGRMLATLFYEPSTRTRLSFEAAGQKLGMGVLSTEDAGKFSSAVKGETLEDSIRTVAGYADAIVIRHQEEGTAARAAAVSKVPIINAGDGKGEHPTQSLLDGYTIKRETGRLTDLVTVIGGDLKHGRTARSLAEFMAIYPNNEIRFVSTPDLRIGDDIKEYLDEKGTTYSETDDMYDAIRGANVVYWTRMQLERMEDPTVATRFVIGQAAMQAMEPDAVLMHPLPKIDEIDPSIDTEPRAAYFRQAENGLYVRMALIDSLLTNN